MDLQLQGKLALVTGSTAGIGFAVAQGLAKEGATVIVNGRAGKRVDQALVALNKAGVSGKLEGLAADLGTCAASEQVCCLQVSLYVRDLAGCKQITRSKGSLPRNRW